MSPDKVLELLKGLDGVIEAFRVNGHILEELQGIESRIKATLDLEVRNQGIEECLNRENIYCIIKDGRFRPPPEPTVLLVGDEELIMGKEIIPTDQTDYHQMEDAVFLSEDFVLFKNIRPKDKEYFLMPPVPFPEVEGIDGASEVVSCSPSGLGDQFLRASHGMEDDPSLASVIIGFNITH
jgi:hypothetical protein